MVEAHTTPAAPPSTVMRAVDRCRQAHSTDQGYRALHPFEVDGVGILDLNRRYRMQRISNCFLVRRSHRSSDGRMVPGVLDSKHGVDDFLRVDDGR